MCGGDWGGGGLMMWIFVNGKNLWMCGREDWEGIVDVW